MTGAPIKLMCSSCAKRAGTATWGETPIGSHVWIVDSRRIIEGARQGEGSDWFSGGVYVDPKAREDRIVQCPYCRSDLRLEVAKLDAATAGQRLVLDLI